MKIEQSKAWWLARADREDDTPIGAGFVALDAGTMTGTHERHASTTGVTEETRIAFGKFVNLMRRRFGFSVERLAEEADLDASELLIIEDDVHYLPEPRTVYRLAQTFKIPQQRLMQLAGLADANDVRFRQEAVRFAARSESIQKLTREENAALEAFVSVLSEREPIKAK
jgi:transcriptional regulator with XRE-family HTH domain